MIEKTKPKDKAPKHIPVEEMCERNIEKCPCPPKVPNANEAFFSVKKNPRAKLTK